MNILMVPSDFAPVIGGVEIAAQKLCRHFMALGHYVEVVTTRLPRSLPRSEVIGGIAVTRLPFVLPKLSPKSLLTFPIRAAQCLAGLERVLRSRPFDLVNMHYVCAAAWYTDICCRRRGLPSVVSLHGADVEQTPYLSSVQGLVTRNAILRAGAVTTNSLSLARSMVRLVGEGRAPRASVVWNGVDLEDFDAVAGSAPAYPKPYVVAVGRMVKKKGFDLLIRAFPAVAKRRPEVGLLLIGDGPERAALERLAAACTVGSRVRFAGWQPNASIVRFLRHAELAVVPSRIEPFGIVALEAMACGKAVVATAVGGLPEVVSDGSTGLLVQDQTPEALAAAMLRLLDDPQLALRLGNTGRQVVEARFTWDSVARRYLEVFQSVLRPATGSRTDPAGSLAQADRRGAACATGEGRRSADSSGGPT